ncbi:MAG: hypothetical protein LBP75_10945 [Planctomycetota bacterium]|nr:hypothetical protein [Planctomycetota bacterium]
MFHAIIMVGLFAVFWFLLSGVWSNLFGERHRNRLKNRRFREGRIEKVKFDKNDKDDVKKDGEARKEKGRVVWGVSLDD